MPSAPSAVQTPNAFKPRIFSGIQPSGGLTLGNYLGALKRFRGKAGRGDRDDLLPGRHACDHRLAGPGQAAPADPRRGRRLHRAGIDPKRSILFNQSQVTAHVELGWIFNCVARMGWMSRMTQFKDKAGKNAEAVSLGLSPIRR
jgi:tryptophanyl-tRNA synthetase